MRPLRETILLSVRRQSKHWIAWRELHGEDEANWKRARGRASTPSSGGWTLAGEERLPVVVDRACLARDHERGKEWTAGKGSLWPTLTHQSATGTPLSPQTRDRPVFLCNTGTHRFHACTYHGWHRASDNVTCGESWLRSCFTAWEGGALSPRAGRTSNQSELGASAAARPTAAPAPRPSAMPAPQPERL